MFIVVIIKDVIEIIKGQGSVLKTVGKVIFAVIMIGVIILVSKNYEKLGNGFSDTAESGIEEVASETSNLFK